MTGPLQGLAVLELAGIGPGPFCGMLLADQGADVVRITRVGGPADDWGRSPVLDRGRSEVLELDLKSPEGVAAALERVRAADVLIEGFRPGVTERLGLGPHDCLAVNQRLVYGRMTGWGQAGPYAARAGHDITYLALSGALHAIGREGERPVPPVNMLGDFGGGGMLLAFGVMCAVHAARRTGRGQVVDASVLDGSVLMTGMMHGMLGEGSWRDEPGVNLLDSGAPFYDVYGCADGRWIAVGALEERFFRTLARELGLAEHPDFAGDHLDRARWPGIRAALTEVFATRTRDDWHARLGDRECCVAPVLSLTEAARDPHNEARGALVERDGVLHPAPAPRFSGPDD